MAAKGERAARGINQEFGISHTTRYEINTVESFCVLPSAEVRGSGEDT